MSLTLDTVAADPLDSLGPIIDEYQRAAYQRSIMRATRTLKINFDTGEIATDADQWLDPEQAAAFKERIFAEVDASLRRSLQQLRRSLASLSDEELRL